MTARELLVLPILLPLGAAVVAALCRGSAGAWVTLIAALMTAGADALLFRAALAGGPLIYPVGGWPVPYGIVLVADGFGAALALVSAVVAAASALHTLAAREPLLSRPLYQPLSLLMLTALGGVFLSGDLFNLYVWMELVILSSIALVALADRPLSAEVTFKYAILSALGSAMLLASVGLVYAAVGTLNLADIAQRVRAGTAGPAHLVAAPLMLFAFLLKGGLFPFHFWLPDAHATAPTPVSAMLSGVLVKIGLYGVVRMGTLLFPGEPLLGLLAPLGAVAALFGALAALVSGTLKRALAYSTIANMGLILLAVGWGGREGLLAALVQAVHHALTKSSLFLSGGWIAERLHHRELGQMGGVAVLSGSAAWAFGLGLLALAGLPPASGFVAKLALFRAGWAAGSPLLVAAALASLLGIAYSVRLFVAVCWGAPEEEAVREWGAGLGSPAAALGLALLVLFLGVWPAALLGAGAAVVSELAQPGIYIRAVLGAAGGGG